MLNSAIAQVAAENNIPFEALPEVLAEQGIDYADYRRDMRKQLMLDQLRRIDVAGRIAVTPREVQQCIADLENNAVVNSEYNLSHILISIPPSATSQQIEEAETRARYGYQPRLAGADVGETAARPARRPTSRAGGE